LNLLAADAIVSKYNLVRVETMGETYVVIGGGPDICSSAMEGAEKVGLFALEAVHFVNNFKIDEGLSVYLRAGLATGQIVAGVLGSIDTLPKYSLFGDTLNYASRLQSSSKKMNIQAAESTYSLLSNSRRLDFTFEERVDDFERHRSERIPSESSKTYWLMGVKTKLEKQDIENVGT